MRLSVWISGEMRVSPVGASIAGKIALPRARAGELGEAPFRGEPVRRLDDDDGLRLLDFAVERPLPVGAGRDAGRLVLVKKRVLEPLAFKPRLHSVGRIIVATRMGNEDARHAAFPNAAFPAAGPTSHFCGSKPFFKCYRKTGGASNR
jgi:hypothetical protein